MKRRSADSVAGFRSGASGPSSSSSRVTTGVGVGVGVGGAGDTRVRGRGRDGSGGNGDGHEQGRGSSRRRLRRELNHRSEEGPSSSMSGGDNGGIGDLGSMGAAACAVENASARARVAAPSAPTLAASTQAPPPLMCFSAEHRRRMGGAGSFLEGWISRDSSCPSTNSRFVDGFEVDGLLIGMSVGYYGRNLHDVSEFLTRHRAMVALMGASGSSGASGGGDGGNGDDAAAAASASHVEVYTSAVSDFQSSQLALQGSGGAADAQDTTALDDDDRRAVATARRHGLALDAALAHASDGDSWFGGGGGGTTLRRHPPLLSAADVFHWHSLLCVGGDGRGGEDGLAGRYRVAEGGTRDGAAHSPPPDSVRDEMEALMRSLAVLERRWLAPRQDDCGTLHAVALAAAAMFGLWDVQPFPIANGVMAGILANWALRRAGVPFPFNPTFAVRELEGAVRATRDNAYLVATADTDGRHFGRYLRGRGVLAPLIRLILDRLAPSMSDFRHTTLADRTRVAAGEAEARAARRVRERAASSGSCAICLESNPNVAALCCGREVHLSCLSAWLRSNPTCVGCRAPLPLSSSPPGTSGTTENQDVDRRPRRLDGDVRGLAGVAATGESTGGGGAVEIDEFFADDADEHSVMSDSTGSFLRHDASSSEGSGATENHVLPGVRMLHDSSSVGSGTTEVHWSLEEESSSVGSEFHVRTTEEESSSVGSGTTEANRLREEEEAEAAEAEAFRRDPRGYVRRRRMGLFGDDDSDGDDDDDDDDDDDGWTGGAGTETRAAAAAAGVSSSLDTGRCGCPRSYGVCRNRAALDCTNNFCHPCCVLNGYHACARHGVEERARE